MNDYEYLLIFFILIDIIDVGKQRKYLRSTKFQLVRRKGEGKGGREKSERENKEVSLVSNKHLKKNHLICLKKLKFLSLICSDFFCHI